MTKLLILAAAVAALAFWWRRRRAPSSPPPLDEAYICPVCDETDCTCGRKTEDETGSLP